MPVPIIGDDPFDLILRNGPLARYSGKLYIGSIPASAWGPALAVRLDLERRVAIRKGLPKPRIRIRVHGVPTR